MMTLASAAAFAPVARVARSSAVKMSFESELGAQPPLGFWDPLGLLANADQERFDRLRYVETKHGRIAQLAILGHLVTTAGYRLPTSLTPGYDLSKVPTGLAALSALPAEAVFGTLLTVAVIEGGFLARQADIEEAQANAAAEKFGWDEEILAKKTAIELNNGRAAQMGILALMVHEKLDNNPYIINSLLGSPVAFN
jgi:prolyl-tRNA editing enzyme YbaK/EbsC (Cys-tRNA(Pro) deacylase)